MLAATPNLMRSRIFPLVGLVIGLVAILVISRIFVKPYQFQGSLIDPPLPAADFTLTTQDNSAFSLSAQRGKIVLMFFGYTNCPDECPTTLADYKNIIESLKEKSKDVRFILVTVDPERDTPAVLKNYINFFNPDIIGLTGGEAALKAVWNSYGIYVVKEPASDNSNNYSVDHTLRIFLIDQQGNLRLTYPYGFDKNGMVGDIRHLLGD